MIFGHAPVIFPGVLGVAIPFRRGFYARLSLLHAGLVLGITGDVGGDFHLTQHGGLLNALALFLVATVGSAVLQQVRRQRPATASDHATKHAVEAGR